MLWIEWIAVGSCLLLCVSQLSKLTKTQWYPTRTYKHPLSTTCGSYPDDGRCWRGDGNLSAGIVLIFPWADMIAVIRPIFNSQSDLSFSDIYLGNLPTQLNKPDRNLLQLLLASRKKAITRKWLSSECPTILDWIRIVHSKSKFTARKG